MQEKAFYREAFFFLLEVVGIYTFEQILLNLDNQIALKTLKNWANKVEKLTDTTFTRKYAKNSKGHNYSYKIFSSNDVEAFSQLVELRNKNVPLDVAIKDIFMSEEEKKNKEVFLIAKKEFEENQTTVKELVEYVQEVLRENAEMKKRLKALEDKVDMLQN